MSNHFTLRPRSSASLQTEDYRIMAPNVDLDEVGLVPCPFIKAC
jgi:hypothetical protein